MVILARFCLLSRLREHENSNLYSKMRVYDGESLREVDPRAKSMQEYKDAAGVDEGMDGVSTRFAFKALSATFNHDPSEITRSEEHTSELQSLMRISYAVFCLKKKNNTMYTYTHNMF